MELRYQAVERLASFFALFSGSTQAINLIFRLFFSGRILNRFGVRAGLLVLPVTHTLDPGDGSSM